VFPDTRQIRAKASARVSKWSSATWFKLTISALFAALHLAAFVHAGHSRLGLDFNHNPGETPYFSDPDAPAVRGFPRQPHRWSRLVVSRLDSQHYIGTAVRGLSACPTDPKAPDAAYLDCGLGWLPAWGTIGGAVASAMSMADDQALVVLSIVFSFVIVFMFTSDIMVSKLGRGIAWATVVGFNVYPSAFYLVTPYTEAVTIACAMAGFVALSRKRWILAGCFVGASTAFRVSAVAYSIGIGCALLLAAWQKRKAKDRDWWRPLIGAALAGWGQMATMLALQFIVGDWRAFLRARSAFGDQHNWHRLIDVTYYVKGFAGQDMDAVFLVAVVAILALTYKEILKKFNSVENTFLVVTSVVTILLSVVAPLAYWGITRYLMLCPMVYFGIGVMWKQHRALFVVWCILCLAFYWHVELCGYITQGNPELCPCLGKMEFGMPFTS
jgi:hypothetical protein